MSDSNSPTGRARKNVNKTPKNESSQSETLLIDETDVNLQQSNEATTSPTVTPDPFDPASLRINPDTAAGAIGVKRKLLTVKVGRPDKMEFVRVHPDSSNRIDTAYIEDKTNREAYLVAPSLWPELPDFIQPVRLCLSVNRHGTPFLWPAKLPDPNGRPMDWHTSMLEAQELAINAWVRVQADMSAGSYAVFEATGNLPEPQWPELTFKDVLKLAFKTRFIDSMNHSFLQELFGEV
ncbi:hypothetical protein LOC67_07405 [Stieleria sp. JC731]|uniref:hypothetical protein n=1 Tax=Pirellulaceae TaxID=2691357 RepID=UPI001E2BF271|nr:hypothetical protein [Stieleria sp. JC731]MCC9600383.1 hypothetical protein [Stieleria sp. JC731]